VRYLQPLVAAVVRSCSQIDLQSTDLPHRILARIEGLSETLPSVDARPDLLLPITWPWMHMTVFSRAEFKTAMYIAIRRELGQTSEIDVSDKTENAAPERVASLKPPRRPYAVDRNCIAPFECPRILLPCCYREGAPESVLSRPR
jgi:hypothetical protein